MKDSTVMTARADKLGGWDRWRLGWAAFWFVLAGVLFYHNARATWWPSATDGETHDEGRTKPISEIQVGERVLGKHPLGEEDDSLEEVDPSTWRKVELRASKREDGWADIVLLRPTHWLSEHGAQVGGAIEVAVPECGIDGESKILAIGPCPEIRSGRGRIVTGTFKHTSAQVVDLYVEGEDEPIGMTANHLFWSEDRQDFVPAGDLQSGERLRAFGGKPRVLRLVPRQASVPVYNLEVAGAHVYCVAGSGLLVHNSGAVECSRIRWDEAAPSYKPQDVFRTDTEAVWPPRPPQGPKPPLTEPTAADWRYQRYLHDQYLDGKGPDDVLPFRQWKERHFNLAQDGHRPGRRGGPDQVGAREALTKEGFRNVENVNLGGKYPDMVRTNAKGGTDYVEVGTMLQNGLPQWRERIKLALEIPALGPNDTLMFVDKLNINRRIMYGRGDNPHTKFWRP